MLHWGGDKNNEGRESERNWNAARSGKESRACLQQFPPSHPCPLRAIAPSFGEAIEGKIHVDGAIPKE